MTIFLMKSIMLSKNYFLLNYLHAPLYQCALWNNIHTLNKIFWEKELKISENWSSLFFLLPKSIPYPLQSLIVLIPEATQRVDLSRLLLRCGLAALVSDLPWKFLKMQVIRPCLLNWLPGVGPGNLHFKQILQGRIFFF